MPVKRRNAKRRLDPTIELKAWSMTFQAGVDYLQELPRIGVRTNDHSRTDLAVAEDAWSRLGARFLQEEAEPDRGAPWGLREFGEPGHAR